MYKITNITKDNRKFRIQRTAEAFFLRPEESVDVPFPLIVERPDVFKVKNLTQNKMEEKCEVTEKKKKHKEVYIDDE